MPVIGAALTALTNPAGSLAGEVSSQLASDLGTVAGNSTMLGNLPEKKRQKKTVQPKSGINFVLYNNVFDIVEANACE